MVVNLTWSGASGSPGVNVWHLRSDGGGDPAIDFDGLSQIVFDFYTALQEYFPTLVQIQMFGELTGVGPDTGNLYSVDSWGLDGSGGANFLPPANCLLVAWKAATGGRSGRGRTFLGPVIEETAEANGSPDEAVRTAVAAAAADLVEASDSFANGAIGIWSRTDALFRDFVTSECPNYFAVLRSRRD